MKLGKLSARPDAVKLRLADYLTGPLPTPPRTFGHQAIISSWQMLGNDRYGDCVFAGAAHETMLWNAEASKVVPFTDQSVLSDYSAVTGFNPTDPSTDNGTDMQVAASYRRKTGVIDASGNRHQVAAYLAIEAGNVHQHQLAAYLFGAVGIGFRFPASAMSQFHAGKAWSYVPGSPIEGGHYVPLVGRTARGFTCVTWGKTQRMTDCFFKRFNDESVAYVTAESLTNGRTLEGFDLATLQADLARVTSVS